MPRRFVIHPGFVVSKTDGEKHYIGAAQLIGLYGVNPRACIVIEPTTFQREATNAAGLRFYHLRPRRDGDYSLRTIINEQT